MSEFVDAVRNMIRLYKDGCTDSCSIKGTQKLCPLHNYDKVNPCTWISEISYDEAALQKMEAEVMEWARTHPEPEYPTWGEWLAERYNLKNDVSIIETIAQQIDADSAAKLGIAPKNG